MRSLRSIDFVQPVAAPDTRAANGAPTPEWPCAARVSAPHNVQVNGNAHAHGTEPHAIDQSLDAERMVLALRHGELLALRYQWCTLPPVDLLIHCSEVNIRDQHWVYGDQTWRHDDEQLNCDELLDRIADHSQHGIVIVLFARHTHAQDHRPAVGSEAVGLP